ncbi:MAG: phosphonate ABC transporter ATP-binding protein [Rhodospirillales bacterium]|nr:phosphonate ABC transporter ATP-binding protein [Rhodospirillales bacterium]
MDWSETKKFPELSKKSVLELRGVKVVYGNNVLALKPTDIKIYSDDVTVLLGPSGAGKSTLLRALNHLVKPTAGKVITRDLGEIHDAKVVRRHRLRTGMIFQQHQLIERMTVLQNILLSRIGNYSFFRSLFPLSAKERSWALECLDRVGLLEKALQRCDALSGGQQQRVGIARAIAQRPDIILADEPVASLDPASSELVLGMLRNICEQDSIPAIVSLHQIEYAKRYADRIIGLSEGEIVFDGPPTALDNKTIRKIYASSPSQEMA